MFHYFFSSIWPPSATFDADLHSVLGVAFGSRDVASTSFGVGRWALRLALHQCEGLEVYGMGKSKSPTSAECSCPDGNYPRSGLRRHIATVSHLEQLAARNGTEVVLLGRAANYGRHDESAVRNIKGIARVDLIDVLVATEGSQMLAAAFATDGYVTQMRPPPWSAPKRDVTVLSTPDGTVLRLHTELPFVRMVPGGRFVDLDCLKRCGQLFRDDATPKGIWFPSKSVQAADIVAQLLVEHRFSPEFKAFPALLLAHELGLGHDEDLAFDAYLMLQTDVEYAEYEALRELLRALGAGELGGLSKRARTLLDHFIAAATHPLYRARLHLQRKAQVWQHEGHLERAAEALGRTLRRIERSRKG